MRKRYRIEEIGLILLYLGLGFVSALVWVRLVTEGLHFYQALLPEAQGRFEFLNQWHQKMISGRAPAPNQYRILTPWLVENLVLRLSPRADIYGAYMAVRAAFVGLTLICFDRYLRTWFSPGAAAGGTLCLAAIIPFTYYAHFQESDPLNLLFTVLAFLLIVRRRDPWLIPVVILASLNRETAILIPAVYLLARWGEAPAEKVVSNATLLAGCWAAVFVGLRVLYGTRPGYTPLIQWPGNVASGMPTLFAVVLFGVLWVLPWLAPKDAPPLLRRSLWLVPPFVLIHYLVAVVEEVRLFLPLAPIVIPLSWWVLFPDARQRPAAPPARARARG